MSIVDTNSNVQQRISDVRDMIDAAIAGQDAFLEGIRNAAATELPTIEAPRIVMYPNAPVVDVTAPAHPAQVDSILTEAQNREPAEPSVVTEFDIAFPKGLDDITFPTIADFTFEEKEYISTLLDTLREKITTDVVDGGTGLTPTEEDAIWRRDEERLELAREEAVDNAVNEWSGRGWSMPNGAIAAQVQEMNEKHRMDRLTRGRDITIKSADLALQNKWKAIEAGIGLETVLVAHHDNVLNRALQAATAVLQLGADIVRTQVAVVTGKIEAYKSELDARVAVERFKLEKYRGAVDVFAKKIDAALGRARGYVDLYQADTQVYSVAVQKAEAVARLLIQQEAIVAEELQGSIKISLEAAKANLEAFIKAAEIRMTAAKAGADIYSAQIASANGAISAVIQLASSGETIATESSTT